MFEQDAKVSVRIPWLCISVLFLRTTCITCELVCEVFVCLNALKKCYVCLNGLRRNVCLNVLKRSWCMIKRCCFKTVEVPILGQQQLSEVSDKDECVRPDLGHQWIKMYTPCFRASMIIFERHAFMKTRFIRWVAYLIYERVLYATCFLVYNVVKDVFINCMLTKP